jgi:DNA-binding NarL/FixJ family response regulator
MTEPSIRVVLVEDHDFYRQGLKEMLSGEGIQVVGDTASGEDGVKLVQRVKPDVVLMDLNLPGISGAEATERIHEADPDVRVVMLTVSVESDDVMDALLAGAAGYLVKGSRLQELVSGIRAAATGQSLLSTEITGKVIARLREHAAAAPPDSMSDVELTERELDVLRLIGEGMENAQIADRLYISTTTVKYHVSNLLEKLGLENRIQAAVFAVRRGLV